VSTLGDLILARDADIAAIERFLDGLADDERVAESLSLKPKAQRRLWDLAADRAVTLDQLVPPSVGAEPVRHFGRNTLPAFTRFEKRFRRPPAELSARDGGGDVLWGYNEGATRPLVGPGYFVVRNTKGDTRGDAVVDYYSVPPQTPEGWPAVKPNDTGVSRVVYGFMHDFLRRVSDHLTIGRAYKHDRRTDNCFVLCRER
jgi:hypothetical protein